MGPFNETFEGTDYLNALSGEQVLDRVETNLVSEEAFGSKCRYGQNIEGRGQERNCRTLLVEAPSGVHDPWEISSGSVKLQMHTVKKEAAGLQGKMQLNVVGQRQKLRSRTKGAKA
jgi:hypothetical protein